MGSLERMPPPIIHPPHRSKLELGSKLKIDLPRGYSNVDGEEMADTEVWYTIDTTVPQPKEVQMKSTQPAAGVAATVAEGKGEGEGAPAAAAAPAAAPVPATLPEVDGEVPPEFAFQGTRALSKSLLKSEVQVTEEQHKQHKPHKGHKKHHRRHHKDGRGSEAKVVRAKTTGECLVFDTPGIVVVKAVSTKPDWQRSEVVVAKYKIKEPPMEPWSLRQGVFAPRLKQYEQPSDFYDSPKTLQKCMERDWAQLMAKLSFRTHFLENELGIGTGLGLTACGPDVVAAAVADAAAPAEGGKPKLSPEERKTRAAAELETVRVALDSIYKERHLVQINRVYCAGSGMGSGNGFVMKNNRWSEFCEDCGFEQWESPEAADGGDGAGSLAAGSLGLGSTASSLSSSTGAGGHKGGQRRDSQFNESLFDEIFVMANLVEGGGGDHSLERPEFVDALVRIAYSKYLNRGHGGRHSDESMRR